MFSPNPVAFQFEGQPLFDSVPGTDDVANNLTLEKWWTIKEMPLLQVGHSHDNGDIAAQTRNCLSRYA
jgi:hypothetical protein